MCNDNPNFSSPRGRKCSDTQIEAMKAVYKLFHQGIITRQRLQEMLRAIDKGIQT